MKQSWLSEQLSTYSKLRLDSSTLLDIFRKLPLNNLCFYVDNAGELATFLVWLQRLVCIVEPAEVPD